MAYLGKTPSQAVRSRYYYTATGGETSLSGADDNSNVLTFTDGNYVDVSLNGATLVAGSDYNTTTTNTIGGLAALTASDIVEVLVYDTFSVFGGNMAADLNFKDNVKANFGTGNDLQIFHDGSNSIIRDAGTGSLKFQYGTSDGVVFDSSGSVGIGGVPASNLDVRGSNSRVRWDLGNAYTYQAATNPAASAFAAGYYDGSEHRWLINSSTKAMIDSSGNVLVGKTTLDYEGTAGLILRGDGLINAARSGGNVTDFNRLSTDGEVVRISKDGSTVGSIGSYAGLYTNIGTSDVGLMFNTGAQAIIPHNMSTNAPRDNAIDLGQNGIRWKDLYLSGGVYLGGTGSANHLDDYEEGTWTPATGGGTAAGGSAAFYIKIGRSVTVMADVTFTGVTSPTHLITGLPFPANGVQTGACIAWNNSSRYLNFLAPTGTSNLSLGNQQSAIENVNDNNRLIFSVTYQT